MQVQLPAVFDKRFGHVTLDQPFAGLRFQLTYLTAIPSEISQDDLIGVGQGIFMDFERSYEVWQRNDPRCGPLGVLKGLGHCSSFSNEDLPSDYLGFVAAAKGLTFDEIVATLGGGEQLDQQNPPIEYWGGTFLCQPFFCGLGICGPETPWNNQFTPKVLDPSTGRYENRPWPASLALQPIGFGVYWGKRIGDFGVPRVPTPPSGPSGTAEPR